MVKNFGISFNNPFLNIPIFAFNLNKSDRTLLSIVKAKIYDNQGENTLKDMIHYLVKLYSCKKNLILSYYVIEHKHP